MLQVRWPPSFIKGSCPGLRVAAAHTWQFISSKVNNTLLISSKDSEKLLELMKKNFREEICAAPHIDGKNLAEHHFSSLLANPIFSNPASRMHASKDTTTEVPKVSKKPFCSNARIHEVSREGPQQALVSEESTFAMMKQCSRLRTLGTTSGGSVSENLSPTNSSAPKATFVAPSWRWTYGHAYPALSFFSRSFVS